MQDIAVIGCGGSGCNIVSCLSADEEIKIITLNVAKSGQNATISMELGDLDGCMGDPILGWSLTEGHRRRISEYICDCGTAMVVSVLGGGVGSGAISVVLECARSLKMKSVALVGIPMSFEASRRVIALDQLQKVVSKADCTIVFDMSQLGKVIGDQIKIQEVLKITDTLMCDAILRLKEMLQGPFLSMFTEKAYTISHSEHIDPTKAAKMALSATLTDSNPAHGRIIVNVDARLGLEDKEMVSTVISDNTGIVPDIVSRNGTGHGMMLFIPIAYRTL